MNIKFKSITHLYHDIFLLIVYWVVTFFSCLGIACLFLPISGIAVEISLTILSLWMSLRLLEHTKQSFQWLHEPNESLDIYSTLQLLQSQIATLPFEEQKTSLKEILHKTIDELTQYILVKHAHEIQEYYHYNNLIFTNKLLRPDMWLKPIPIAFIQPKSNMTTSLLINNLLAKNTTIKIAYHLLQQLNTATKDSCLIVTEPQYIHIDLNENIISKETKSFIENYDQSMTYEPRESLLLQQQHWLKSVLFICITAVMSWGIGGIISQTMSIAFSHVFHLSILSILDLYAPIRVITSILLAPLLYYFTHHILDPQHDHRIDIIQLPIAALGFTVTCLTSLALLQQLPFISHIQDYLLHNDTVGWTHGLILLGDTIPQISIIAIVMLLSICLYQSLKTKSNNTLPSILSFVFSAFITYFAHLHPSLSIAPSLLIFSITQIFSTRIIPTIAKLPQAYHSAEELISEAKNNPAHTSLEKHLTYDAVNDSPLPKTS